jgi:hypothetical protein
MIWGNMVQVDLGLSEANLLHMVLIFFHNLVNEALLK